MQTQNQGPTRLVL